MHTERLHAARHSDVARAAELLRQGLVVAFPTETVYGLGVRADRPEAMRELERLKARPPGKPFARLIASAGDMERHAAPGPVARRLAARFWPGPLTLVVADGRGGQVGLRCPDCAVTLALLRRVGVPVAAPSANPSGEPPATDAGEVLAAFEGRIAAVLDGGRAALGVASTVVRASGGAPEVLREGAIPAGRILEAAGGAHAT